MTKDCGGVGVNVNTDVLALRKGKGDGGAEVEVGEVDDAEEGIIGHHRVEDTVEGSERGSFGGRRARGEKTVTSRGATNTSFDVSPKRAGGARVKNGGRRPFFLHDPVVVSRGGSGKMDRG